MPRVLFYLLFSFSIYFAACKKKEEAEPDPAPEPKRGIEINVSYSLGSLPLQTDQLIYHTASNYPYSVTKLVYYLSEVRLIKPDSSYVFLKDHQYLDAKVPETNRFLIQDVPVGEYIGLAWSIGLDSVRNTSNYLAPTPENINMQWPEPMGGGYHFLKLEGHFKDGAETHGYAMHLGTAMCLVKIALYKNISITTGSVHSIRLKMDLNEWFMNPHTYDFVKDGNYNMGNDLSMKKISENGRDVFTFQ
jgi:hypothetical protein